jgi:hypothetical protein
VRYVISTTLALGDRVWEVEFTLACRKNMRYRLLLGSKALIDGQLVVNPGLKYVQDKPVFPVPTPPQVLHEDRCAVAQSASVFHPPPGRSRYQRGHEMVVIDTLRAYMNIASHKPQIHYRGKPLEGFDAVIPRIGASVTFYGCAVLRQFEMMGVFPLNESVAIARRGTSCARCSCCRGGHRPAGHRVRPLAGRYSRPDPMVNGAPLVIKVLEGTQGIGVVLCETARRPSR